MCLQSDLGSFVKNGLKGVGGGGGGGGRCGCRELLSVTMVLEVIY